MRVAQQQRSSKSLSALAWSFISVLGFRRLCSDSTLRKATLEVLRNWPVPLPHILCLGPGLSSFPEELYDSGFKRITIIDASKVAVEAHKHRLRDTPRSGLNIVHGGAACLGSFLAYASGVRACAAT